MPPRALFLAALVCALALATPPPLGHPHGAAHAFAPEVTRLSFGSGGVADRASRDGVSTRATLASCGSGGICADFQGTMAAGTYNMWCVNRKTVAQAVWVRYTGAYNVTVTAPDAANLRYDAATSTFAVYFVIGVNQVWNNVVNLTAPTSGPYVTPLIGGVENAVMNYNSTITIKAFIGVTFYWNLLSANWSVQQRLVIPKAASGWYHVFIYPQTTQPLTTAYDYTDTALTTLAYHIIVSNITTGTYLLGYYNSTVYTGNPYTGGQCMQNGLNTTTRTILITHAYYTNPSVLPSDLWVGDCFYLNVYSINGPVSIGNTFVYRPVVAEGAGILDSSPPTYNNAWSSTDLVTYPTVTYGSGYTRLFYITALSVGTATLSVNVETNVPEEFASLSVAVGTFNVHNYGDVSLSGVPASVEVYTSFTVTASATLPVVGETRSLTLTPTSTGASAAFTPTSCTLSGAATSCQFSVQMTNSGPYNITVGLGGSAAYQYNQPAYVLGTAILTPGNVSAVGPTYIYIGTPRTLIVNITRLPVVGQSLTVTPTVVSGTGSVVFTPTSQTFDSTTSNSLAFSMAAQTAGTFNYKVVSSGTALSTYTIKDVLGLSSTLAAPTTLVISVPATIIKNTATLFNVTLPLAPRASTGLTVTPSATGAIFTPTSVTTTSATKLSFSVTLVSTGPVTFSLATSGTAIDQYLTATQDATVIDPPGELTVNALADTPTVWLGTPRSFVVSATPSTGYTLIITPSIQSGPGSVTLSPGVLTYGFGVYSRSLTLTPVSAGSVTIAFTLSGSGSTPFLTPTPVTITVRAQDQELFTAPTTVPPLSAASFPITLSSAPLGLPVTVTPTVTINSGTPSVLTGVIFAVGDSTLTRSFVYTPQAVGSMDISLSVTNPYGQYTVQTVGTTSIGFAVKGGITTNLPNNASVGVAYDVTVTLDTAPVAAIKVELIVTGGAVTGGTSGAGRLDFAAGVTTAACRITFSAGGNQTLSIDPYVDTYSQYAAPADRIISVAGLISAPDAPDNVAVTSDDSHVNITWDAPASNGGAAISSYVFTFYGDQAQTAVMHTETTDGGARAIYASELVAGTTYFLSGVAINSAGTSARSSRIQVQMSAAPSASSTTSSGDDTSTTGTPPDAIIAAPPATTVVNNTLIYAVIGAAVGLLLLVLIVALVAINRRNAKAARERIASDNGATIQLDLSQSQGTRRYVEKLLGQRTTTSIGRGGTAEVFKAKDEDGEFVAIKRLTQHHPKAMAEFHQEVTILSQLGGRNHPNVIGLKCFSDEPACIVMELAESGSLYDLLKTSHKLKNDKKVTYIYQVAAGMQFLHSCYIAHLDIKPRNILIGNGGVLKITDFGVSQPTHVPYTTTEFAGTPAYAPPERFRLNLTIDLTKSDVFSYGLTILALLTGKEPYSGQSVDSIVARHSSVTRTLDSADQASFRSMNGAFDPEHSFPTTVPEKLRNVLQSCVTILPDSRPPFAEVVRGVRESEWAEGVILDDNEGATVFVPLRSGSQLSSALSSFNTLPPNSFAAPVENPVFSMMRRESFAPNGPGNDFDSQLMSGGFGANGGASVNSNLDSSAGLLVPPPAIPVKPAPASRPVSGAPALPDLPPPSAKVDFQFNSVQKV